MRKVLIEVHSGGEAEDRELTLERIIGPDVETNRLDRAASNSADAAMTTGVISGFDPSGAPVVRFAYKNRATTSVARRAVSISQCRVGSGVVLLLEDADPERPIVVGVIQDDQPNSNSVAEAVIDGERLILAAQKEIVLRCGNASLTLTRAGKVLIQGAYVLSRSSGVNRIKGGSVQIN